MKTKQATYFCIDIEANGPVPGLYDMVSLGAVCVQPIDGKLRKGESFYIELKPTAPRIEAEAAAIHGLDLELLKKNGLERKEACDSLANWVKQNTLENSKAVFVGHNAPFDWSFISWIYAAEDLPNPFGYKALCTKSLAAGVLDLHWFDTNKEILAEKLDLNQEDTGLKHRADYDAMYQADILIRLLETQGRFF